MARMEINIDMGRVDRAVDDLRRVGRAAREASDGGPGAGGGRVSGPASRFSRAEEQRRRAYAGGDEHTIFDAEYNYRRAADAYERAQRGGERSFTERLETFARSTRFGMGGVSPLLGRALDVFGAGRFGPAALAAGAAFSLGGSALAAAQSTLGPIGDAARLGLSPGQIGAFGSVGLQGRGAADAAEAFRQRLLSDPIAANVALQGGIRARPGLAGAADAPRILQQGIELLQRTTDAEERLRRARALGLTDLLRYVEVSRDVDRGLRRQAEIEANIARGRGPKDMNDLNVATETFTRSVQSLGSALAAPSIPLLTEFATGITAITQGVSSFLNQPFVQEFMRISLRTALRFGAPDLGGGGDGRTPTEKLNDSIKKLDGTLQTGVLGPGGYGAIGPRGRRALPEAWHHDIISRGLEAGAIRSGEIII